MTVSWTADMECALFYSMIEHKPVGENKHFHMIFIYEKFNNLNEKKLSTTQLWDHLGQLYDLQELDDNEVKPFPNEEVEFSLPESIRRKSSTQNSPDLAETPKSVLKSKNNKSNESLFKSNLDSMDTDRDNSTNNSPKNESSSILNSSSSQNNQKNSINDENDNSSVEDASETSARAARLSLLAKNDVRKKNKTTPAVTTKQSKTNQESKPTTKKRK